MSYKEIVKEARELGVLSAGLSKLELKQRIEDKKNGAGIYKNALIDPDTNVDTLMDIADDFGIKTYSPSLTQNELFIKINEYLKNGYKLGERYNKEPKISTLNNEELISYYLKYREAMKNNPKDQKAKYIVNKCLSEFLIKKLEVPKIS